MLLALAAGVLVVALVPLFDRSATPGTDRAGTAQGPDDADVVEVAGSRAQIVTVRLELQPGWTVPAVASDVADAAAVHSHVGDVPTVAALPAGSDSFGAAIDVRRGAESFVVRSPVARDLAFRTGTEQRWGPWQSLGIGDDEGPDANPGGEGADSGPPAATPMLIPPGSDRIELVDRRGDDEPVEIIFLPGFDGPPDAGFDEPASPSLAAADAPAIMPRSSWTNAGWNTDNGSCSAGPSSADHLQALVVHHTVTGNTYGADQVDDLLRAIHYTHTEVNGWCDIGYNFVVDRFGRIWEARTGSIENSVIGGHARGFNTGTVGVALLGQHHAGAWPPASAVSQPSQEAVEVLANWKLGAEGVDPNGRTWLRNRSSASRQRLAGETWHYVPTVLGHRDLGLTSCPGSHGMELVDALPDRLGARQDGSLPYRWVGWRSHDHGPAFAIADTRGGLRPAGSANPWPQSPSDVGTGGAVVAVGGDLDGGYLLTTSGALLAYGDAPDPGSPVPVGGAIDLVVRGDGVSGWVLDGTGVLRGFGGAPDITDASSISDPIAAAVADDGRGYVLDRSGRLAPVGGLPAAQVSASSGATLVDLTLNGPDAGWVVDEAGKLHGFGGRGNNQVSTAAPPVAVVASPPDPGGWVLDRQGQLWPFGGARYVLPVATASRSADVVDVDGVGLVYSASFLQGGDARYIERLHRLFYGRPGTDGELDLGVTRLEQGADRIDLAAPMARSEHWVGASLDRMYRDVLGREPDPEGRSYWMGQIAAGLGIEELGTYFYGSAEYAAAAGSDEAYVRGLYQALLSREPDGDGLAYWVGQLAGSARPPDVAAGFYSSIESRRDRAGDIYQQIFGQPPSAQQRDELAGRLANLGDVGLAADLAASSSFYRLAADGPEP